MSKSFSRMWSLLVVLVVGGFGMVSSAWAKDVTDVLGRVVDVPEHVQRGVWLWLLILCVWSEFYA